MKTPSLRDPRSERPTLWAVALWLAGTGGAAALFGRDWVDALVFLSLALHGWLWWASVMARLTLLPEPLHSWVMARRDRMLQLFFEEM